MAKTKKSTEQKSIPVMYQGIPTARTNILVMEDIDGRFSLHNNLAALERLKSFTPLIKDTICKSWENFNAFEKENEQTILTYHANLFGAEPPKRQDLIVTAVMVWNKMHHTAKVDMTSADPVTATGRKSTILSSTYTFGEVTEGTGDLRTPQAMACLKIFRDTLKAKQDADMAVAEASGKQLKEYVPSITEAELKLAIEQRASELATKQDPWRIFQYYRPSLIACKFIKRTS